ncbi:uncharacterized protein LOC134702133 isoform X2 [Mytilus trossulus]|uniref:uncharacterized protein LOC134702133 isoform X2 n=1 Tax=Mytilus trossulus TaxID=6551 RepID=UPI003007575E
MQLTSIYFNNLKMLLKLTIILFINLSICIKNSSTATPEINYECTPERYVKIQNKTLVRDHRLKVLKKNGEACDLNNITINTCGVKQGEPVSLLLQEDNTTEVVGGHNSFKFQLNCTDEGVYTVISSSEIEVKPPTTLIPLKRPAYHAISLSILDSSNAPITGAVHVGQELKMIMEITDGITAYVWRPRKTHKNTLDKQMMVTEVTTVPISP